MKLLQSAEDALQLDAADPLQRFRSEFCLPATTGVKEPIYLAGHSLGLAPRAARRFILQDLDDWERMGVAGHHAALQPWIDYAEQAQHGLSLLTGAAAEDVLAMNALTTNLHLLLSSFYRPQGQRTRVMIESGAFSSDRHAIASQIAAQGFDPVDTLVELEPLPGADLIGAEQIDEAIALEGDRLALVLWPGVQYRTGQAFDCARIASAAHTAGAIAGFDHAHAIGNLPLNLMADDADFAVWCSYKYLNAGPGAVGGLFVHPRHAQRPRLAGWWGHESTTRFQMGPHFLAAAGAAGWAVSNPPIFSTAPLLASLQLFAEASIEALRQKSVALTAQLEQQIEAHSANRVMIITPADPAQRGGMLTLRFRGGSAQARRIYDALSASGVTCDWREPDLVRVTPAPLYNSFSDVWRFARRLTAALDAGG